MILFAALAVALSAIILAWASRRHEVALANRPTATSPELDSRLRQFTREVEIPPQPEEQTNSGRPHGASDGPSLRFDEVPRYRPPSSGLGQKYDPHDEERAVRQRRSKRRRSTLTDYYALLQVERSATPRQIEQAYRREAALLHPDRFYSDPVKRREAEERMRKLNRAMETLRDPVRRATYDARL